MRIKVYKNCFSFMNRDINLVLHSNGECIIVNIQSNERYYLIVLTLFPSAISSYSVVSIGPSHINFNQSLDDMKSTIVTNYSSDFNNESQIHGYHNCYVFNYYYEALTINVFTSDFYVMSSDSNLDTFAYLYKYPFDPYSSIDTSLFRNDDGSCVNNQFKITTYLQLNITYVLFITTSYLNREKVQGPFSLIVKGPDRIDINKMDTL